MLTRPHSPLFSYEYKTFERRHTLAERKPKITATIPPYFFLTMSTITGFTHYMDITLQSQFLTPGEDVSQETDNIME